MVFHKSIAQRRFSTVSTTDSSQAEHHAESLDEVRQRLAFPSSLSQNPPPNRQHVSNSTLRRATIATIPVLPRSGEISIPTKLNNLATAGTSVYAKREIASCRRSLPSLPTSKETKKNALPAGFVPGVHDVICGKGKIARTHEGNLRFHQFVLQNYLPRYEKNKNNRLEKTMIVTEIMERVNEIGAFVKFDRKEGRWLRVDDLAGRERTSQILRDALEFQYRSSKRSRSIARRAAQVHDVMHDVDDEHQTSNSGAPQRRRTQVQNEIEVALCLRDLSSVTKRPTVHANANGPLDREMSELVMT